MGPEFSAGGSLLLQKGGRRFFPSLSCVLILSSLFLISHYNFLLFHSLAETFSIVIAFGIFAVAWNSRRFMDNNYLLFVGIAYMFVGTVDVLHTLSYKGMGVFKGFTANLPTQLWISARYMESFSLLFAPAFLGRRLRPELVIAGFIALVALLLLSIFYLDIFPVCYIEGAGLTPFKKYSEYIICLVLVASAVIVLRRRKEFDERVLKLLMLSIVATVFSELAFTFYIGVYDFSNVMGHFFKIISFYLIYKAIIVTGLVKPYDLIFRDLKRNVSLLESANRELESFSYSVSHDLRAPLRAIKGFSDALVQDYSGALDDEGRRFLDIIRNNTIKMGKLIDDLLALSRVGRQGIRKADIDMQKLAAEVFAEVTEGAGRPVRFEVKTLPPVSGDPALVRQVYVNLLSNAVKFTRRRDIAVIEAGGRSEGSENIYYVKDNGAGFDMAYRDKLFAVFQRLHSTEEFEGTGVGLAIVQRVISRHGGRVWAEGKVDEGATFYFSLPVL